MNFDDWYNATIGKQIDIDGAYGDQCVDVAMSWAQFCFPGHNWPELLGYGDAKDLYNASNPTYFDKLQSNPQQGDMVIFGATGTNPYGHIAVIISANDSLMNVIEQNGFNPSGVAYTAQRPYINVIGFLRPKGVDMFTDAQVDEFISSTYNEIAGRAPTDADFNFHRQGFKDHGISWALTMVQGFASNNDVIAKVNAGDVVNVYRVAIGRDPNTNDHTAWDGKNWKDFIYDLIARPDFIGKTDAQVITELKDQLSKAGGTIDPATQAKIDQINATTQSTNSIVQWIKDLLSKIFK